jgi:uncharacterized coiled-coil DUF342 family protein
VTVLIAGSNPWAEENAALRQRVTELEADLDAATSERDDLVEQVNQLLGERDGWTTRVETLTAAYEAASADKQFLAGVIESARQTLAQAS